MLSEIWKLFDDLLSQYKCTRVKTLGDCYVFVTETSAKMTAVIHFFSLNLFWLMFYCLFLQNTCI